ncbi:MAG TPA: efflux RND transporter periplasmic adaptor subunit [Bacteroidales bacterium]|nr:efflux RND transporter periplasmic adaptor subunit [Bacteroidales bacterium]
MKTIQISILLPGMLFSLISCRPSASKQMPKDLAEQVSVMRIVEQKARYYDSYPATTIALKEVDLRGGVNGYITGIYFKEGSVVRQGQKLYEIDRSKYEAAYDEAKANVEIAQANLEKVQHDFDRYTVLGKADAIAQQKLDYAAVDLSNAKMGLVTAKAELVKARTDLDYSLISSPFDGTIGISQVKMGSLVTAGQTLLNTISSDDPMGIDFQIDQTELNRFHALESLTAENADSVFRVSLPGGNPYPVPGLIYFIDRAVDPQTGTIRVRLAFPNREGELRPGMSCNVRVKSDNSAPVILIPMKAMTEQMGEFFVFRISGSIAKEIKIVPGRRVGDQVIVPSGLASGDSIVVEGIQKLHDGSRIRITGDASPGSKNNQH